MNRVSIDYAHFILNNVMPICAHRMIVRRCHTCRLSEILYETQAADMDPFTYCILSTVLTRSLV